MSAYLFMVSNQGQMQKVERARKHKKKRTTDDTKSIHSSRSSTSSNRSDKHKQPKMRFDVNTSTYVPFSQYEKRSKRYAEKYDRVVNECKYHEHNLSLNQSPMMDEKTIHMLRYTFFKKITGDYEEVTKDMKAKTNGQYKLKYMRKLTEVKTRERNLVSGLPNLSIDDLSLGPSISGLNLSEEDEENDQDTIGTSTASFQTQFQEQEDDFDDFNNLYRHYQNLGCKKALSIKDLFKSNQLWNDIYQDLKFNLMELSTSFDYFELLPNLSQLISLYKEMVEYFLLNLNHLSANTQDLTEEEAAKISKNSFFYLRDFNYEWFKIMSNLHFKFFNDQSVINSNLGVNHDSNFNIHKTLITRIIDTIIDNFKTSVNEASYAPVFDTWKKFLNFMITELVFRNYQDNELNLYDNLPEPNLPEPNVGRSRTSSLTSYGSGTSEKSNSASNSLNNSLLTANTSTDENINNAINGITKNTKNLSINTHSLTNLSQSKISIIKEEDHLYCDEVELDLEEYESDFLYKRKGFIIEPPTPRIEQGTFPTPLSTSFSINSEDTKSFGSKRSVFSKFRRNKIRV